MYQTPIHDLALTQRPIHSGTNRVPICSSFRQVGNHVDWKASDLGDEIILTITDNANVRWTYQHPNTETTDVTVQAGQQNMTSGNTGRSGTHAYPSKFAPPAQRHGP